MKTLQKLTVIALGMVSAMLFAAGASSQPAGAVQARNVVLVHGAWADGSSWSEVIARLQAAGLHVTAVQNPLTSLADSVAATRRIVELVVLFEDVLLVGGADAYARVLDDDADGVRVFLAPYRYRPFVRVLDGIGQQVAQYAFDP